jgi:NAD(P)-dependent dehydrogenase (short-subunit alcohol dehydrogenase family)
MPRAKARTVVITGGSAGVGRATALAFAQRGWNVALLARDASGLESAAKEIEQAGGQALTISADIADSEAVFAAAAHVTERWGAIDVWINNAMVTVFAPLAEITPEEFRRVTEVTYLGFAFGTMAALRHMRPRNAGTIVQVGSALSYRAIPLQTAYCGAKFAIRGFTDGLRSELQHDNSAIRVTMVQLPAVNTPQVDWARNKMPRRPQPIPPIHQPEGIAETIFRASQRPSRELWVGLASVRAILGTMIAPGLLDWLLAGAAGYEGQLTSETRRQGEADNLFQSVPGRHLAHGRFDDRSRLKAFAFDPALLRPALIVFTAALIFASGILVGLVLPEKQAMSADKLTLTEFGEFCAERQQYTFGRKMVIYKLNCSTMSFTNARLQTSVKVRERARS